jgi:hypothetical protein
LAKNRGNRRSVREVQVKIAEYLLNLEAEDPIKSVRELASAFKASVGTISNAIQYLESAEIVKIDRRGHLGSFLIEKSLGGLWNVIQEGPLVIAFTIPSNLRFEGLATALKALLKASSIQTYLIFIRGSSTRIQALRENRCNAIVLSKLTADGQCGKNEKVALELSPESWLTENRLYFRKGKESSTAPIKVGIDPDSYDHKLITELEFKNQPYDAVLTNFTQLPRLLLGGQIDATVWNAEDDRFSASSAIYTRPLSPAVQKELGGRDASATLVTKKNAQSIQTILKNAIDPEELREIQQSVIAGEMLPEY